MNHRAQTLYEILGIPCGVGVDHIKDSYRLLTKKTPRTDCAYAVLSDPVKKQQYDAELWAAATSEPQRHEISNPKQDHDRGYIQWQDGGSDPEADEWLRTAKEEFLNQQNPIIGYQCGMGADSGA